MSSTRLNIPQLIKFGLHLGCHPRHIHQHNHSYSFGRKNSNIIINLVETCFLLRKFIFFAKKLIAKKGLLFVYNSPLHFGTPVEVPCYSAQLLKANVKNGCLSNFLIQKEGLAIHKLSNRRLFRKIFSSNPFLNVGFVRPSRIQKNARSPSLVFFPRLDDNNIPLKNTKRRLMVSSTAEDLSYFCGTSDYFFPSNNRSSASISYFTRLFWNIGG